MNLLKVPEVDNAVFWLELEPEALQLAACVVCYHALNLQQFCQNIRGTSV